jgi:DNA gyrase/topoisomerase IV subunit B
MNPVQLSDTTLDPSNRELKKVEMEDKGDAKKHST